MKTIGQIRRERLALLQDERKLSFAAINEHLGRSRRDGTLSQIANQAPNSKTGKPRQMGDEQARELETVFKLDVGWFDTDPFIDELLTRINRLESELVERDANGQWPFKLTSSDVYFSLPDIERERIEALVVSMVHFFMARNQATGSADKDASDAREHGKSHGILNPLHN